MAQEREKPESTFEHSALKDIHPSWNVQQLPDVVTKKLAMEMGLKSVLKVHPDERDGGANAICLHLFRETNQIVNNSTQHEDEGSGLFQWFNKTSDHRFDAPQTEIRFDTYDEYHEGEAGGSARGFNALNRQVPGSNNQQFELAVFMQLVHSGVSKKGQKILLELRSGEIVSFKDPGSFGQVIKVIHDSLRSIPSAHYRGHMSDRGGAVRSARSCIYSRALARKSSAERGNWKSITI